MSDQATIVAISNQQPAPFATALADSHIFPVVDATWDTAFEAIAKVQPAAVIASATAAEMPAFAQLATKLSARQPYIPLIAIDPAIALPGHAIPILGGRGQFERLGARLRNALRIRALHATVLRRLTAENLHTLTTNAPDPLDDATVMLVGRGGSHAALSVSLGERVSLVGALSIEAAAKHLNARDLDGIVIGDGFTPRVLDAFLTVLAEDPRFRSLPVIVTSTGLADYDLANLETITGDADHVAQLALPLVRQRAFEARLSRTLRSIDSEGLIDAATGLLTPEAFDRDLATAVYHTQTRGGGLSAARFTFKDIPLRTQRDAARIISRLMRKIDFGTLCADGSIVVVFAETDPRNAHMIARRLSAVMKHTMHGPKRDARNDPRVKVIGMTPDDSAKSLLARLQDTEAQRAAS